MEAALRGCGYQHEEPTVQVLCLVTCSPRFNDGEIKPDIQSSWVLPGTFQSYLFLFFMCSYNFNKATVPALKTKCEDSTCYATYHLPKTSKKDTAEPSLAMVVFSSPVMRSHWKDRTLTCQSRKWPTELPASFGLNYGNPQRMLSLGCFSFQHPPCSLLTWGRKGRDKRKKMSKRLKYPLPSRRKFQWYLWTLNSGSGYLKEKVEKWISKFLLTREIHMKNQLKLPQTALYHIPVMLVHFDSIYHSYPLQVTAVTHFNYVYF